MLPEILSTHFAALEGSTTSLGLPDGRLLAVQVDEVSEKPLSRMGEQRMPFAVMLTAPTGTDFVDGLCAIELPEVGRVEGIFVSRVPPAGRDPAAAYFCIVFN